MGMLRETMRNIVTAQEEELEQQDTGIERALKKTVDMETPHAVIISGVRRSGKSTLLRQLMAEQEDAAYLSFEDSRLADFELTDFETLKQVVEEEQGKATYFLDEVQNVPEWERFVRSQQDNGEKFVITGSNASLLSKELGTRLTGRHLTYELFPFSYRESLELVERKPGPDSFKRFLETGGFPEFLQYENPQILHELLNDVLMRDIAVRHNVKDTKTLQELAVYLLTNIGKEFTYNKLRKYFDMGSTNTVSAYISHFTDAYLFFTVPQFHYSAKKQMVNPKKLYAIDTGLANMHSLSASPDKGRILENAVFLELRRNHEDIYYFQGEHECDFLVREDRGIVAAVQSCYRVTERNKERELAGLEEVGEKFQPENSFIVTFDQEDHVNGVDLIPAWKWMHTSTDQQAK